MTASLELMDEGIPAKYTQIPVTSKLTSQTDGIWLEKPNLFVRIWT